MENNDGKARAGSRMNSVACTALGRQSSTGKPLARTTLSALLPINSRYAPLPCADIAMMSAPHA